MAGVPKSGALAVAALCLCLPGAARAQSYTIHLPKTVLASQFEFSVAYPQTGGNGSRQAARKVSSTAGTATAATGDWEVTIALDLARCEITCVYRRLRETTHLLPPVAEIHLHSESGPLPDAVVLDPAG